MEELNKEEKTRKSLNDLLLQTVVEDFAKTNFLDPNNIKLLDIFKADLTEMMEDEYFELHAMMKAFRDENKKLKQEIEELKEYIKTLSLIGVKESIDSMEKMRNKRKTIREKIIEEMERDENKDKLITSEHKKIISEIINLNSD